MGGRGRRPFRHRPTLCLLTYGFVWDMIVFVVKNDLSFHYKFLKMPAEAGGWE